MNTNCEQVLNYCSSGSRDNYTIGNLTLNTIISVPYVDQVLDSGQRGQVPGRIWDLRSTSSACMRRCENGLRGQSGCPLDHRIWDFFPGEWIERGSHLYHSAAAGREHWGCWSSVLPILSTFRIPSCGYGGPSSCGCNSAGLWRRALVLLSRGQDLCLGPWASAAPALRGALGVALRGQEQR
jgi:hypothetical protein